MSFFKKLKKDISPSKTSSEKQKEKKEKAKNRKKPSPKKTRKPSPKRAKKEAEIPISPVKKSPPDWIKTEGQLTVDVYQTDSEFFVKAPIAGINPEDISVSVENDMLVIKGKREKKEEIKEKNYFYQECYWGTFSRKVILPEDVDTQRVKATLKNGILTVKVPRTKSTKKKKIAVKPEE